MSARNLLIGLAIVCPCVATSAAAAELPEPDTPALSLAAFGTLGVVHSSEDQADFVHTTTVPRGAGASGKLAADVDSLIGVQLTAVPVERLTAVVQIVAEHGYDNSYRPHVEWANLRYELLPGLALRAGRIALPIFMHTESRKVGFALPWVRTPLEVYELAPVTTSDGVDVTWNRLFGRGQNTFQLAVGKSRAKYAGRAGTHYEAVTRNQFVAANTYELGKVVLRANYGQGQLRIDALQPIFDAFRLFGPAGEALARRHEVRGKTARFMGASVSWDPGPWSVAGELGRLDSGSALGDRVGGYLSVGRRFRDVTPYLTWSELSQRSATADPGLDPAQVPASLAPVAAGLNASLNLVLNGAQQSTATAGVRWDALRNVSLKLQYDHLDLARGSRGTLSNLQPGYQPGGTVHLLSASLDFVL